VTAAAGPARVLELAIAASSAPLSIETLLGWNLARPTDLWSFLAAARAEGRIAERAAGTFAFDDEGRRNEALASATAEDWGALLVTPERIAWTLDAARAALAERRFAAARVLYDVLVATRARELFPGGVEGWLALVLESLRLFRAMEGIATSDLQAALELAEARGDVGLQGVLHGALAAAALRDGRLGEARRHLAHARDAAPATTGRLRVEIHMYLAVGLVFQGRLRDGIESFEELLGDVPEELATLIEPASPTPARSLIVLSAAYCAAGQVPRVLDLVHRLRAFGRERGVPILEHEADLFASLAHATREEYAAARPHAERAWAFYGGDPRADPIHLWFAATSLACVLAAEGRWDEIPPVLARGLEGRRASRWTGFANTAALSLLEQLEVGGVAVEGLDLDRELDAIAALPSIFWQGVAQRYRARRLARAPRDDADLRAVREHLDRAVTLLREAGAGYELARALADAAGLARGAGRAGEAARLGAELREAAARSPEPGAEEGASGAARLTGVLVELGRLGSLAARREGTWGEIAARLCRSLGAERCALVERGDPPRLLAQRGGGTAWREVVLALLAARPPAAVEALPAPEVAGDLAPGQLLVVPFAAEGRAGWACLENRYGVAAVGPRDVELLEVLSVQLGILLGNVALSQQLASARERLEQENRYWRSTRAATAPGSRIVGDSPGLRGVLDLVARVAPTTTAVLVTGETGVGKELVAAEIHRQSARRDGPFIPVHVASFSPGLVASGLFGHERGAFTGAVEQAKGRFELADGGTLFLDEVGELAPEDQVRLLRVLQEGAFERVGGTRPIRSDFRLVAATNRDLQAEVRAGRFREDLYFRLAAFPLRVPPLRERREEIPTLALFFMERASRARGVRFEGIGEADMRRMLEYPWPGNVRELEHVVERAVVLSEPPRLRIPPLDAATRSRPGPAPEAEPAELLTLAEAERRHVARVLRHVKGRITGAGGAAEILGLKPSTLNFRIRKLGLEDEVRRARASARQE
jgi:transcriptional regulator with GAF, ATPase, and Fis domain